MSSLEKEISTVKKDKQRSTPNPSHVLAAHAVDAMLDKKARDVTVMDMRNVSGVADYFVIGTGESDLQVKAVADAIRERIHEQCGERPWHTEGTNSWKWVLLDYVDLVAHVFSAEKRSFYDLERLWGDAPSEHVHEDGTSIDMELLQAAARDDDATSRKKAGGSG